MSVVVVAFLAIAFLAGCKSTRRPVTRPSRHSVRSDQLVVLSDFRLPPEHPLIEDLVRLRAQIAETLELPMPRTDVVVYLFADERQYRQYLDAIYPGLPRRRAYFVGTDAELAVYTYWGERIREDLRHEYTHGLLHASLAHVPLWIDEGLAEYFEVAGPEPGTVNADYVQRLAASLENGWRPDLSRLEQMEEFSQMQRIDYQEAWAWVHYALHSTPAARSALLSYLRDLQSDPRPEPLSTRLARRQPQVTVRFLNYLGSLDTGQLSAGRGATKRWRRAGLTTATDETVTDETVSRQ